MASEIELHPGHWKNTGSGASGILNEVTEARKVAKRVYEILQAAGVPSTYFEDNTSTTKTQNINTLVAHHNADRNGLVVSIHLNSSGATTNKGVGTEVLYKTQKDLAVKLVNAISAASGLINRGAKFRDDLAVLNRSYEPAVLIEVCFVNSSADAAAYQRDFEKICQAIARELASAIGKTITPPTTSAKNGWVKESNVWYFYVSGVKKTGWIQDKGSWFYLNSDGSMKTGWVQDKGKWYFLNPNGDMRIGWLKDKEQWYYLKEDGSMATGKITVKGKPYFLQENGVLLITNSDGVILNG